MNEPTEWRTIDTAPRDGSYVKLAAITIDDDGTVIDFVGPYLMRWNDAATNVLVGDVVGMWVMVGGFSTWDESRGHGPTHWAPGAHLIN